MKYLQLGKQLHKGNSLFQTLLKNFLCVITLPVIMFLYILWASHAHGGQERALGLSDLELHMVVSSQLGAGKQTQKLCKSSILLYCRAISLRPQ